MFDFKSRMMRAGSLDLIRQEMLRMDQENRDANKSEKWKIKDRAIEALDQTSHYKLASSLRECRNGSVCGSLWCPECRKSCVSRYSTQVARKCAKLGFGNNDLFHITAHLGVTNVDSDEVRRMIEDDDKVWRRVRKRPGAVGLWVTAVYEFELVHRPGLMRSTVQASVLKKKQVKQMVDAYNGDHLGDTVVYVHWHGLTNKNPCEWLSKRDYYLLDSKTFKTNECGVYSQSLYRHQSFKHNLEKICSYPFKNPDRFKHSFIGSDFNSGERMTNNELSSLVKLYQDVQGRQKKSLFRNIK
jgi:hypothetical protein